MWSTAFWKSLGAQTFALSQRKNGRIIKHEVNNGLTHMLLEKKKKTVCLRVLGKWNIKELKGLFILFFLTNWWNKDKVKDASFWTLMYMNQRGNGDNKKKKS